MKVFFALIFLLRTINTHSRPPGCGKETFYPKGKWFRNNSTAHSGRYWEQYIDKQYDMNTETPVYIFLHGQDSTAIEKTKKFGIENSTYKSFVQVFPQGIDDHVSADCGTGWNVIDSASSHDKATCNSNADDSLCCYQSCLDQKVCTGDSAEANCGWATCVDDTQFILDIVDQLTNLELCIGDIYIAGESNGGMMIHGLLAEYPSMFRSAMSVYGLPFIGYNNVPSALNMTSMFSMHDRSDEIIPWYGGEAGGWFYESGIAVMSKHAVVHNCSKTTPEVVRTPYDGGESNISCLN